MWRPLLLLLPLAAPAARAGQTFQRLEGVLAATPSETLRTVSHVACSSRCSRLSYGQCAAYSFATDGTCWLYPRMCQRTEPSENHPGVVSYAKPAETGPWCPANNGVAFEDRCFLRRTSAFPVTWQAAQEACRTLDACSQLAMPTQRAAFLALWAINRPNAYEWIGAEDWDGDGVITNTDGSSSWTPAMYSWAGAGPILLPDRYLSEIHRTTPVSGNVNRYVCQAPLRCQASQPCPAGWLLLDKHCFQYFAESRTWGDAHAFCTTQGTNGQLASPSSNGVWLVLWDRLLNNADTRVFMGADDIGHEGLWYTKDGGGIGVPWGGSQPDNAGGNEHCLEMIGSWANDIPCDHPRHFICRSDAGRPGVLSARRATPTPCSWPPHSHLTHGRHLASGENEPPAGPHPISWSADATDLIRPATLEQLQTRGPQIRSRNSASNTEPVQVKREYLLMHRTIHSLYICSRGRLLKTAAARGW